MNRPTLYMLIGVPASGKSSWVKRQMFDNQQTYVASTDDYIESVASVLNTTYNEVFTANINAATKAMNKEVKAAIDLGLDIVWDQTNTTFFSRKRKLQMIPPSYKKVAVFFPTPDEETLKKRLDSRVGKKIPERFVHLAIVSLEPPDKFEGFDEIIVVQ